MHVYIYMIICRYIYSINHKYDEEHDSLLSQVSLLEGIFLNKPQIDPFSGLPANSFSLAQYQVTKSRAKTSVAFAKSRRPRPKIRTSPPDGSKLQALEKGRDPKQPNPRVGKNHLNTQMFCKGQQNSPQKKAKLDKMCIKSMRCLNIACKDDGT